MGFNEVLDEIKNCDFCASDDYFPHKNGDASLKKMVLTEDLIREMNSYMRLKLLILDITENKNQELMRCNARYVKIVNWLLGMVGQQKFKILALNEKLRPLTKTNRKYEELISFTYERKKEAVDALFVLSLAHKKLEKMVYKQERIINKKNKLLKNVDVRLQTALKELDREIKINKQLKKDLKRLKKKCVVS